MDNKLKSFKVEVEERLVKVFDVKAESLEEAEDQIKRLYNKQKIVLSVAHFQGTNFFTEQISDEEYGENETITEYLKNREEV